ncbi:MAG: TRAP transporter TatT component family protein [Candidatus Aminicenantales bacterium]
MKSHDLKSRKYSGPIKTRGILAAMLISGLMVSTACSIQKMALNATAGVLSSSSGSDVFTQDNDPELVGDALPFAIKLYESLLAALPEHQGLRLRTGSLYIMYANAFLQTPADMMPKEETTQKDFLLQRAKNLYLRGRDILLVGLEKKNPLLRAQLKERHFQQALAAYTPEDAPALYWTAAGWVAAFAIDPGDMKLGITLPQAAALMERIIQLDPRFAQASVYNFYILYYGSIPDYMGGDPQKARDYFQKAVAASGNRDTSAFLSLAVTVSQKAQNVGEFKSLLQKVLDFDPETAPENRLINILNQRKARWLLEHIEDFFLLDEGKDGTIKKDRVK